MAGSPVGSHDGGSNVPVVKCDENMGGWINKLIDGCIDGSIDESVDEAIDESIDESIDEHVSSSVAHIIDCGNNSR